MCAAHGMCDCKASHSLMMTNPGVMSLHDDFCKHAAMLKPVGGNDQVLCEASDAGTDPQYLIDGKAGNTNFPHGDFKVLATAGEYNPKTYDLLTGVPDGIGAYLKDASTVRVVYQSESYGQIVKVSLGPNAESTPWFVNDKSASFTGSHIHFVDYDRTNMSKFMTHKEAAMYMVKDSGDLPTTAYNLKGEKVGPRSRDGPTTTGAHESNVDIDGNYIVAEGSTADVKATPPTKADWLMQSLCSAHLETKHQWGTGLGVEDDLFITNEEWITYKADSPNIIGLPAHVVDLATRTIYATSAFTLGGFEKIVEVNTGTTDFVAFSPSGYNGNFGGNIKEVATAARNAAYTRSDGNPYVYPQDIVPARLYIGKKNVKKDGTADTTSFMARNGFEHGALYGFAVDCSVVTETRDNWHKTAKDGDKVEGAYYKMKWSHTPGEVKAFIHDGSWEYQDAPQGAPAGWCFWNGQGKDTKAKKTEHNSPDPRGGAKVLQGSTAGYFGIYDFSGITDLLKDGNLPDSIPATYTCKQGSTDIDAMIELGGQGKTADGNDALQLTDSSKTVKRFEDIDAIEWFAATDGDWVFIHEDSGQLHGERKFLAKMGTPIKYYFAAMSGGKKNTRQLALVSGVKESLSKPNGHEFSGGFDLTGLLAMDGTNFALAYPMPAGKKRELDAVAPINDKKFLVSLQAHGHLGGSSKSFASDRISQVLMYQPKIPTA
eukprot:gnl/MRDRNA2_/MRDRNA2_83870_c0_seq1.p1 gnl/MRDRNA2_/MRDRNA2_83870_c0~~gnl/MRDRNA2_/MRDRNA2_83870_c0_seq1.p1  ORF type:complete len:771 (-),score=170.08 gnl/MRDRNA2_/MRDRNA2_83870_c0_seq1:463-2601(-)